MGRSIGQETYTCSLCGPAFAKREVVNARAGEARAAITALVHNYAARIDAGDLDGVASLFVDAEWRSGDSDQPVLRGAEAIRTIFERVQHYEGTPRTTHQISNLTIDVEPGGCTASSVCTFVVLQGVEVGAPIEVILTGTYEDRFELVESVWRFAARRVRPQLLGDLRRHYR